MDKWNTGPIIYDKKSRRMADERCRPKRATSRDVQLKISTVIAKMECFLAQVSLTAGRFFSLRDLWLSERLP
jgi:hypothetical protein